MRRRTKRDSQEDKGQGCSAWHSPPRSSSRCFLSPRRLFRSCHPEERSDEGSFHQGPPLRGKKILRSAQDDRGTGTLRRTRGCAQEDKERQSGGQGAGSLEHGIPLPRHRAVAFCHPGASSASVILRSAATKDLSTREPPCGGRRSFAPLRMTGGRGRSGGQGAVRRRSKERQSGGQGAALRRTETKSRP